MHCGRTARTPDSRLSQRRVLKKSDHSTASVTTRVANATQGTRSSQGHLVLVWEVRESPRREAAGGCRGTCQPRCIYSVLHPSGVGAQAGRLGAAGLRRCGRGRAEQGPWAGPWWMDGAGGREAGVLARRRPPRTAALTCAGTTGHLFKMQFWMLEIWGRGKRVCFSRKFPGGAELLSCCFTGHKTGDRGIRCQHSGDSPVCTPARLASSVSLGTCSPLAVTTTARTLTPALWLYS